MASSATGSSSWTRRTGSARMRTASENPQPTPSPRNCAACPGVSSATDPTAPSLPPTATGPAAHHLRSRRPKRAGLTWTAPRQTPFEQFRRAGLPPFRTKPPCSREESVVSPSIRVLSTRRKVVAAAAALTMAGAVSAATSPANAATAECGPGCISVFSSELGTYADVNAVEAVLDGGAARLGQPVGLKPVSGTDPAEDFRPGGATGGGKVSDFYAGGVVSAEAN